MQELKKTQSKTSWIASLSDITWHEWENAETLDITKENYYHLYDEYTKIIGVQAVLFEKMQSLKKLFDAYCEAVLCPDVGNLSELEHEIDKYKKSYKREQQP